MVYTISNKPASVDFSDFKKVFEHLSALIKKDEDEWELNITKIDDHYIFKGKPGICEEITKWIVKGDLEMLNETGDFFNVFGSKHDFERIRVIREKRDDD